MNIAYFVYNFDNYSGAAFQAEKIASYLNKDHKIFIFSVNNFDKTDTYKLKDNIVVINLYGNILKQTLSIINIVKNNNIEIFHVHGFITRALIIARFMKKKILLKTTLMGTDDFDSILEKSTGLKKTVKMYLLKRVDFNVTLTSKMKQINSKHLDNSKIRVIPNGVTIPELNNYNIKNKKNIFCIVGLICPRKRTYESIKYYIDNYSNLPESKLYIVGPTKSKLPEFELDYMEKCYSLINANKEKNIIITGKLNHEKLADIYSKSKSIILFSEKEGMPNVILEAMSYNTVPIMSEMDGVSKEILENNEYGFILNDLNEIVNIEDIEKLLVEEEPMKRVSKKYNIKNIASQYEEVYHEIQTK